MKAFFNQFRKIFPWLVTAALFAYLFYQIPPRKVLEAFVFVKPLLFAFYALTYFFLVMMIDCYSLSKVLSKFCVPVSFGEIFPARGVSYLLALVNYNAGQAGLAYFLKRSKNASFFKAMGSILFIMVIDLYWVVLFAFVGSFFVQLHLGNLNLSHWVQRLGIVLFLAMLVHLAFWRGWFSRIFPFKIRIRFFDWLRGRHLFQTFHQAKVLDYVEIALQRFPLHLIILFSFYFAVMTFRSHISLSTIFTTVPVILLVGTLPITPGGLGTVQAATIELLQGKIQSPIFTSQSVTPAEILFAISLACMVANYLLKVIVGALCLKKLDRSLFQETNALR